MTRIAVKVDESGAIVDVVELEAAEAAPEGAREVAGELAGALRAHPAWYRLEGAAFVERPFKALRLGAGGIHEATEDLESSAELTAQHVDLRLHGGDCDLAPRRYRWDEARLALVPIGATARPLAGTRVSLDAAFAQLLELNPKLKQGDQTMVWLAGYRASLEAAPRMRRPRGAR